mgnify:CR=1 FL=1
MWRSVERSDPVDRQVAARAPADKQVPAAARQAAYKQVQRAAVRNIAAADSAPQPAVAMAHTAAAPEVARTGLVADNLQALVQSRHHRFAGQVRGARPQLGPVAP